MLLQMNNEEEHPQSTKNMNRIYTLKHTQTRKWETLF